MIKSDLELLIELDEIAYKRYNTSYSKLTLAEQIKCNLEVELEYTDVNFDNKKG